MHNSFNINNISDEEINNMQPTQSEAEYMTKKQAQNFYTELFDLTARYSLSLLGEMERAGMGSVGESLMEATNKLELLKQSL